MTCSRLKHGSHTAILGVLLLATGMALVVGGCPRDNGETPPVVGPPEAGEFVMGFIGPLSGDAASFGTSQKNGIELAVEQLNAAGGLNGRQIRVVYEDSQLDQNKAITALNKLVDSDHAEVILGESSSANTIAIGPLAERKGVLLVSPLASAESVTQSGFPIFRISPSDSFQARIAAQFAAKQGWKRGSVLYTNDEWGTGLAEAFTAEFAKTGGEVAASQGVNPQASDLRTELTKIKGLGGDFVYAPLHPDEAIVAVKQARQLGLDTSFLGADSFSEPTIREAAGDAVEGVVYTVPAAGSGDVYERFASAYQTAYGEEPNVNAAAAFDAVMVVAEAAKRAGDTGPSSLAQALRTVADFPGASGTITFDENGDVTSKAYDIVRIKQGQPEVVESAVTAN